MSDYASVGSVLALATLGNSNPVFFLVERVDHKNIFWPTLHLRPLGDGKLSAAAIINVLRSNHLLDDHGLFSAHEAALRAHKKWRVATPLEALAVLATGDED